MRAVSTRKSLLILTLVALSAAALLLVFHSRRYAELQVVIAVTNQGAAVRFLNLGEARWSGAAYQIHPLGDHTVTVASGDAGQPVSVPPGVYDIEINFSDGETIDQRWMNAVSIQSDFRVTYELHVSTSAVGPQELKNTWKP